MPLLVIEAHCNYLSEKPDLDLDEMAVFLRDGFQSMVTSFSMGRAHITKDWSQKTDVNVLENKMRTCETMTYIFSLNISEARQKRY